MTALQIIALIAAILFSVVTIKMVMAVLFFCILALSHLMRGSEMDYWRIHSGYEQGIYASLFAFMAAVIGCLFLWASISLIDYSNITEIISK